MSPRLKIPLTVLAVAAYPFLGAYLVRQGWAPWVLVLFATLTAFRAVRAGARSTRLGHGLMAALCLLGAFFAEDIATRLIPAFVYLSVALLFGHTLRHPPSLIERMVRLQFPEFQPGIADYLRQLTWVWTGLFVVSAVICAGLATLPDSRPWTLFTGLVVYVLMGVLAVGEYLYRPHRFPDMDMPSPVESFKVMARDGHKVFRGLGR
ncbi:hypothetical protein [Methylomagnum sp.]